MCVFPTGSSHSQTVYSCWLSVFVTEGPTPHLYFQVLFLGSFWSCPSLVLLAKATPPFSPSLVELTSILSVLSVDYLLGMGGRFCSCFCCSWNSVQHSVGSCHTVASFTFVLLLVTELKYEHISFCADTVYTDRREAVVKLSDQFQVVSLKTALLDVKLWI